MSIALTGMSMRLKFVLVVVATVVVTAIWFLASYHPTQAKVAKVRTEVTSVRAQVASLEAQLKHLQDLQRNEPKLRAKLARFATAVPSDPRLPQFILSVQDAANKAHVDFLSVTPSLPSAPAAAPAASASSSASGSPSTGGAAPSAGIQEITVSLTTTGSYFTLQNFIYRLENLDRAIRIDTFSVAPGGGASGASPASITSGATKLSVSMSFRMFVSKVAAQAGA